MSDLRALYLLRRNIETLLSRRKESQTALASWLGKGKSWINKFLNGHREIQLKDLDRIADFFGIATYQLFQPGISMLTERRIKQRRSGVERRIGYPQREANVRAEMLNAVSPQHKARQRPTDSGLEPTHAVTSGLPRRKESGRRDDTDADGGDLSPGERQAAQRLQHQLEATRPRAARLPVPPSTRRAKSKVRAGGA